MKDADYNRQNHQTQLRKLEMCRILSGLIFNEQGHTGWFDESEHEGKKYAARIRRLSSATDPTATYRIQVGVAEGEAVGGTEDATFIYEYGEVSFSAGSEEEMKFATIAKIHHLPGKAPRPQDISEDTEAFGAIEYTIAQAGVHLVASRQPADMRA